jgi:hypothetical protein
MDVGGLGQRGDLCHPGLQAGVPDVLRRGQRPTRRCGLVHANSSDENLVGMPEYLASLVRDGRGSPDNGQADRQVMTLAKHFPANVIGS